MKEAAFEDFVPKIFYHVFRKCPQEWRLRTHTVDDYDLTYANLFLFIFEPLNHTYHERFYVYGILAKGSFSVTPRLHKNGAARKNGQPHIS